MMRKNSLVTQISKITVTHNNLLSAKQDYAEAMVLLSKLYLEVLAEVMLISNLWKMLDGILDKRENL